MIFAFSIFYLLILGALLYLDYRASSQDQSSRDWVDSHMERPEDWDDDGT